MGLKQEYGEISGLINDYDFVPNKRALKFNEVVCFYNFSVARLLTLTKFHKRGRRSWKTQEQALLDQGRELVWTS